MLPATGALAPGPIPMVTDLIFNLHKTQLNHIKWQKRNLPVYQNHFFCFNCKVNSMNHFLWLKIMRVQTFFIFSASLSWKITFFWIIYDHFFVSCLICFHSFSCESQRWMFSPRWGLEEGLYSSHKYMKRNMQRVFINANIRAVGLVIRQQEK